jgi:hypothetical protein
MLEWFWSGSRDEKVSSKCHSSGSESRPKLVGVLEMVEKAWCGWV